MKAHHSDEAVELPGYTVFRRDRKKRKGGGVALYARRSFCGRVLDLSELYPDAIELLWIVITVNCRSCYVGAVYHQRKSVYRLEELSSALERSLEYIFARNDDSLVIIGGDFNQFPSTFLPSLGLVEVFFGPTHAGHNLNRIYASENVYPYSRAIDSTINTKHKAVVARCEPIMNNQSQNKVFWDPRLDTIVGPHTHPTLPS